MALFQKGQPSAYPKGRKQGARDRLQKQFLYDLCEAWERDGKSALKICAIEEPTRFVHICASLMPKAVEVDIAGPLSEMSDEELQAALQSIRQLRADAITGIAIDVTAPAMKLVTDDRHSK
jgi:hypothetical protein